MSQNFRYYDFNSTIFFSDTFVFPTTILPLHINLKNDCYVRHGQQQSVFPSRLSIILCWLLRLVAHIRSAKILWNVDYKEQSWEVLCEPHNYWAKLPSCRGYFLV